MGNCQKLSFHRSQSTLVIVDHNDEHLNSSTLSSITAASKLKYDIHCLVVGQKVESVAQELTKVGALKKILVSENEAYKGLLPEVLVPLVIELQNSNNYSHIICSSSSFGKNFIPRFAAQLDVSPISEVIAIKDESTFVRYLNLFFKFSIFKRCFF